jgi:FkbM family methyltransferase
MNSSFNRLVKGFLYLILRFVFNRKFLIANCRFIRAKLKCHTADVIGRHLFKYGIHERENSIFLLHNFSLKEHEIALDIGANLGWFSVLLSRLSEDGSLIYSFEPDEANFNLLKYNLSSNGCENVKPVKLAVSNEVGISTFFKYPLKNTGRHSLLPKDGLEKVHVETTTLDSFLLNNELSRVKYLKIDIEGYEYFALLGATNLLSFNPIIMMEYSPHLYSECCSADKLIGLLSSRSYKPFILNNGILKEISFEELLNTDKQIDVFLQNNRTLN